MATPSESATAIATSFREGGYRVAGLIESIRNTLNALSLPEHEAFLRALSTELRGSAARGDREEAEAREEAARRREVDIPEEVKKRLNLPGDFEITEDQVIYLLSQTLPFLLTIDQLVWAAWKNIAPESKVRRQGRNVVSVPNMLREYLQGNARLPENEMNQVIEKTRQLAAGLIGSIGPIGRTYGRKQAAKFSPSTIQELVRREGTKGTIFGGEEVKYWRKFMQLVEDMDEDLIEKEIHQAIARYTEDLLKGSRM